MQKEIIKDHFIYVARVQSLAAGQTLSNIINIEADSNFVAVKITGFADIAGAAQTDSTKVVPLVRVSIQDSGSGRNLQNIPVPMDSLSGRGELPFILAIPRRFKANASIRVTFENYSAATNYANVELSLVGYKEFMLG